MQLDLTVMAMPTASLVPYAANARTHSEAQVGQIAASIAEFGFVNPVLVDAAGVLVAGQLAPLLARFGVLGPLFAIGLGTCATWAFIFARPHWFLGDDADILRELLARIRQRLPGLR